MLPILGYLERGLGSSAKSEWYHWAPERKCAKNLHCSVAAAGRRHGATSTRSNVPGVVVLSSRGPLQSSTHQRRQLVRVLPRLNHPKFLSMGSVNSRIPLCQPRGFGGSQEQDQGGRSRRSGGDVWPREAPHRACAPRAK